MRIAYANLIDVTAGWGTTATTVEEALLEMGEEITEGGKRRWRKVWDKIFGA